MREAGVSVITGGVCRVTLDLQKLGLGADVNAANIETGEPVKRVAAGEFEFLQHQDAGARRMAARGRRYRSKASPAALL